MKNNKNDGGVAVSEPLGAAVQEKETIPTVKTEQGTAVRQSEGTAGQQESVEQVKQPHETANQSQDTARPSRKTQPSNKNSQSYETVAQPKSETTQTSRKNSQSLKKALQVSKKASSTPKKASQPPLAPDKLILLVTVVNLEKGEYFLDLLQSFGNLQMAFAAVGTAAKTFGLLAPETEKTVIFSVVTQENAKLALSVLEEKFASIRQGKGVAFSVPLTCTIGVAIYKFLCNKEG